MAEYRLSRAAQNDLLAIARYTVRTFGAEQSKIYRDGFKACFELIAENPMLGRSQDRIRLGLRCYEHKTHSVFYIEKDNGVLIVRVLHEKQDPARHLGN